MNEDITRRLQDQEARIARLETLEFSQGVSPVWEFIEEQILAAPAANVTFAAIPGQYRSLVMVCQLRSSTVADSDRLEIRFNGDSGANYDWARLLACEVYGAGAGDGTFAQGNRAQNEIGIASFEADNARADNFTPLHIYFDGYALTDREKWAHTTSSGMFVDVSSDNDMFLTWYRGRWRDTDAITTILLMPNSGGNFTTGSRIQLYGIL